MIELKNESFNVRCQSCSKEANLYTLHIQNKYRSGVEISLCKECCLTLRNLLSVVHLDDVKMMSMEELD